MRKGCRCDRRIFASLSSGYPTLLRTCLRTELQTLFTMRIRTLRYKVRFRAEQVARVLVAGDACRSTERRQVPEAAAATTTVKVEAKAAERPG